MAHTSQKLACYYWPVAVIASIYIVLLLSCLFAAFDVTIMFERQQMAMMITTMMMMMRMKLMMMLLLMLLMMLRMAVFMAVVAMVMTTCVVPAGDFEVLCRPDDSLVKFA